MKLIPGTLQGGGAPFCSTHWSVVLLVAQEESEAAAQDALRVFCQAYWPPLYAFLRRRGYSSEDAQDLTQGFFAHLLEHNTLSRACREKGRLRTFLLGSLQHYLANEYDRARTLKRGGDKQIVSIDDHLAKAEAATCADARADPTNCFDQSWATTLVRQAWERLRAEFEAEGKTQRLEALKPFVFGGTDAPPDQEQTALRLGVPVATLRTWLQRLRGRYREAVRLEVARTVSNEAEVEEEMRYLYRLLVS